MAKNNYIQFRVNDAQKFNIKTNAVKNNQTITDYIMTAIIEFEKRNLLCKASNKTSYRGPRQRD